MNDLVLDDFHEIFLSAILLQMSGNCSCKEKVIGSKCDMCSAGFFDVTQGCLGTRPASFLLFPSGSGKGSRTEKLYNFFS